MTQTLQSDTDDRRMVLEMLGFSNAEKAMLASTFRLTPQRVFRYAEASAPHDRTDVYLVNADNPDGLSQLHLRSPNVHVPAVLIGREPLKTGWPLIEKPIHWSRLFDQLDSVMQTAITERTRRRHAHHSHWDGRTYRRANDKDSTALLLPQRTAESVLIVDDSATVRAFMRAKLARFRFDLDYAESGEQAIDMALAKDYNCVFLDIMMPGIDGYTVCKRMKSSPSMKDMTVIMLSSKSSAFDKFRGNWAGCDAYLGKPVTEKELHDTVARFIPGASSLQTDILT